MPKEKPTIKAKAVKHIPKTRASEGYRWRDLGIEVIFGAVTLFAITLAKLAWDGSDLGRRFETFVETELQRKLSWDQGTDDLGAVVVDIKNISKQAVDGQMTTDPDELFLLVQEIIDAKPLAVAVDVDFGPKTEGPLKHPKHSQFFKECLRLSHSSGVPIYLGVYDSQNGKPKDWLGDEEFIDLAAGMVVPHPSYRVQWWRDAGHGRLESISSKLARAYGANQPPTVRGWAWALETEMENHVTSFDGKQVKVGEIIYDSSPLNRLISGTIEAPLQRSTRETSAKLFTQSTARRFLGKMVLLGDGQFSAVDKYPLPSMDLVNNDADSNPWAVPGVYIHACGALTPIKGYLWSLTHWGRIAVDFAIGLGAMATIWLLQTTILLSRAGKRVNEKFVNHIMTVLVLGLVFSVSYIFLKEWRLVWVDFPVVALAVLFHRSIHHWIEPSVMKGIRWFNTNLFEK